MESRLIMWYTCQFRRGCQADTTTTPQQGTTARAQSSGNYTIPEIYIGQYVFFFIWLNEVDILEIIM